ncbi:hypothetical protein ACJZ2D_004552 [Fusarium nematophilum]
MRRLAGLVLFVVPLLTTANDCIVDPLEVLIGNPLSDLSLEYVNSLSGKVTEFCLGHGSADAKSFVAAPLVHRGSPCKPKTCPADEPWTMLPDETASSACSCLGITPETTTGSAATSAETLTTGVATTDEPVITSAATTSEDQATSTSSAASTTTTSPPVDRCSVFYQTEVEGVGNHVESYAFESRLECCQSCQTNCVTRAFLDFGLCQHLVRNIPVDGTIPSNECPLGAIGYHFRPPNPVGKTGQGPCEFQE